MPHWVHPGKCRYYQAELVRDLFGDWSLARFSHTEAGCVGECDAFLNMRSVTREGGTRRKVMWRKKGQLWRL